MFNIDIDHHARDVFVFLSEVRAISLGTKQLAHVDVLATQTVKRGMGDNLKELRTLMAMS